MTRLALAFLVLLSTSARGETTHEQVIACLNAGGCSFIVHGQARVIDGDSLEIAGKRIRIFGIDAPEHAQTCEGHADEVYQCGRDATATLANIIGGQRVYCLSTGEDRYGRTVAQCITETVPDIGAEMVERGRAVPYRKYGGAVYDEQERRAKAAGVGIHSGRFTMPAEWRKERRR